MEMAKEVRCEMDTYIERMKNMREDLDKLELDNTTRKKLELDSDGNI